MTDLSTKIMQFSPTGPSDHCSVCGKRYKGEVWLHKHKAKLRHYGPDELTPFTLLLQEFDEPTSVDWWDDAVPA